MAYKVCVSDSDRNNVTFIVDEMFEVTALVRFATDSGLTAAISMESFDARIGG